MSKIHQIPGQNLSPAAFLGKLLEQADDIEHIACVVQFKDDGPTQTFHTAMPLMQAVWMQYCFNSNFPKEDTDEG